MVDRVKLTNDRLVITKPGYSASSPSTPDAQKVFDSNWLFSGTVIVSKLCKPILPDAAGTWTYYYGKTLGYVPTGMALTWAGSETIDQQPSGGWPPGGQRIATPIDARAYNNRVEVDYPARGSYPRDETGWDYRYGYGAFWLFVVGAGP